MWEEFDLIALENKLDKFEAAAGEAENSERLVKIKPQTIIELCESVRGLIDDARSDVKIEEVADL